MRAMSNHYLFETTNHDRLRHIAGKFQAIKLKPQEYVFRIGDDSNGMFYILERGTLNVRFPAGKHTKLKPGQCFGDVALLYQCERCMTVRSVYLSFTIPFLTTLKRTGTSRKRGMCDMESDL